MTIDEEVKAAKVPALQHPTVWKRTGEREVGDERAERAAEEPLSHLWKWRSSEFLQRLRT